MSAKIEVGDILNAIEARCNRLVDILAYLRGQGFGDLPNDLPVDRALQRARKQGYITYSSAKGWERTEKAASYHCENCVGDPDK